MIGLLYFIVLLSIHYEDLVFRVFSGEDIHLCIVEGTLDDVKFERWQWRQSEVADLSDFTLIVGLNWQ